MEKKNRNVLSLIYLKIYHVVDVIHGIKKSKNFSSQMRINFHQKKKKKKKKKKKAIVKLLMG